MPCSGHTFRSRIYPLKAAEWIFPADSASGHLVEQKEDRAMLSKWGNDLRQSFRTIATAAGVSEFDAKLLMNHAIPGVNAGYITRHKLLEDHLRSQQQAISSAVFAALGASFIENPVIRDWLGRDRSRRLAVVANIEQIWSATDRQAGRARGCLSSTLRHNWLRGDATISNCCIRIK
jgi:hypothetical protein